MPEMATLEVSSREPFGSLSFELGILFVVEQQRCKFRSGRFGILCNLQ